ncbi:MAG: Rpp14/Pop5 family protein [Candidatus Woesearchaeota archaeon]
MKGTANKKNVSQIKITKQKVLLPTLKEQQRYVVYRLILKNLLKNYNAANFGNFHNNIILQCNSMLGIFDGGKAGLMSAKYNADKMSGIIRVNNNYVDKLKVCLGLITLVDGQDVNINCVYVSGMLHKAIDKMNI